MAATNKVNHNCFIKYTFSVDVQIFSEDKENIEYIIGESVENANFSEDIVIIEMLVGLFTSIAICDTRGILTPNMRIYLPVLDSFLLDDQWGRLREVTTKLTGVKNEDFPKYVE